MKYFNFENKSNILTFVSLGLIILFGIFFSLKQKDTIGIHSKTAFFFDTVIEISLYDSLSDNDAEQILDDTLKLCEKYENLFSKTKEGSDIWRINESAGEDVTIDSSTYELLEAACAFAQKSGGTADPTIGSLTSIWNITDENFSVPSEKEISEALKHVNYKNLIFNSEKCLVSKSDPETKVDLGFIAKGYIADKLKAYLEGRGINSGIINLGGNIICIGQKSNDSPFVIGIKDPLNPKEKVITQVSVCSKSVVSSGAYERNKVINNELYHHILSTKNGYPASSDLSQVTIINSSSIEGDALSTLCYIYGYEKSKEFLKNFYPEVNAVFVDKEGIILEY